MDKESRKMAYAFTNSQGNKYYLHKRESTLENGRTQTIYFFAKEVKDGSLDAVPTGYEVSESRNGLPVLRSKNLVDKEGRKMAYAFTNSQGNKYYLHKRESTLENGRTQTIYFFAKEVKDGSLDAVPTGYEVSESRNGLPVLRSKKSYR